MAAILFILCCVAGAGIYTGIFRPLYRGIARLLSKGH